METDIGTVIGRNNVTLLMLILFSVLAYAVYLLIKFIVYLNHLNTYFKGCPGHKRHWIYGNVHLLPEKGQERLMFSLKNSQMFPRYYIFWITSLQPTVFVTHPDTVKAIMTTPEPKSIGFAGAYRLALPWLGEGLLISAGQKWARARRLLTPAFHFEILKPYMTVYNDAADILVRNLGTFADDKKCFEVFTHVSKTTLDIIMRCAFSYQSNCQKLSGEIHPYMKAVEELSSLWNYRARKPWLLPDTIFYLTSKGRQFRKNCNFVHKFAEDIIERRKNILKLAGEREHKYLDFLDILLRARDEDGKGLTELEIRNEVDTFLFAGHDTTASAISWILYSLATHPDCQRKCQKEIDSILEGRDSDDIEWSDLANLEYLTMCIKEGMRDHCPVPFIQREITHDFEMDGKTFPAGTSVSLHIYGLHHNKNIWENPMEYIPERFTKENIAEMDNFQFVPFSAGPRNCIGQHFAMNEEKVVLAKLLRGFWFELDSTREVKKRVAAVMRTEDGMYMYAKRREHK